MDKHIKIELVNLHLTSNPMEYMGKHINLLNISLLDYIIVTIRLDHCMGLN
jgi:hypothetical protein